jgi:hypothetical protein
LYTFNIPYSGIECSPLDVALEYARHGIPVFPARAQEETINVWRKGVKREEKRKVKSPRTPNGFKSVFCNVARWHRLGDCFVQLLG